MKATVFMLFYWLWALTTAEDSGDTYKALKEIQRKINENVPPFCFHRHSGTKHAFVSNAYKQFVGDLPVLVYPFCLVTNELGNRLGNYLNEVACADASGLHFITVHHQWDITGSYNGNSTTNNVTTSLTDSQKLAFLRALPDVIVHKNPLPRAKAVPKIQHTCHCTSFCWSHVKSPWVNRTAILGQYVRKAVESYYTALDKTVGTTITPDVDFTNAKPGQVLPLIPDVALQYRCGDNIAFSWMYGILPFTAFDTRIPPNSKHIYVLSDHPSRAAHSPYTSRCHQILSHLLDYLKERNPSSTIVVKRGGDLFLDYARLAMAEVAICSPSSYCFWPAIARDKVAHFPLTGLIAGADNMQLAPDFGPNFKWIEEPSYISNFKNINPWTKIFDILEGKVKQ